MKKASRILTIILIAVFVLSVFAGCDLIGRDVAKYRKSEAIQIGNETITIGKLLDTFNRYYNQYYYYISLGYLDAEYLFEMSMNSLIRQYVIVDDYVQNNQPVSPALKDKAHNAEYLTSEEYEYVVKYVMYLAFDAFDQNVEKNISNKYELQDEEVEDTSRDFAEKDKLLDSTSYAKHMYLQNVTSEEADEYFEKYYDFDFATIDSVNTASYVYAADSEFAQKRVDEFNKRLVEEEGEEAVEGLTVSEYIEIQLDTIKQYEDTIKNNYNISMNEFFLNQLNDMVTSCIVAKWNYEIYKDLENDDELQTTLQGNYQTLKDEFLENRTVNDNFDSFITGLSSSDFILDVPEVNKQEYVFVKNILIPFSTEQTNRLKNLANSLGKTDDERYMGKRDEEATRIEAEYFYSSKYDESIEELFASFLNENEDKDADSKYEKISDIFTSEGGALSVNQSGILGQFFGADGVVNAMDGKSAEETIVELMKRFNTDVGQHSSEYDYVVYVGKDWEDYSHPWVKEFYTAVNELRDSSDNFNGIGKYAMCVSDYGVHIIYVVDYVDSYEFEFNYSDRLNTETASYKLFKTYFESQVSLRTQEKSGELLKKYIDDNKISVKDIFAVFLDENSFEFELETYLQELKDEL